MCTSPPNFLGLCLILEYILGKNCSQCKDLHIGTSKFVVCYFILLLRLGCLILVVHSFRQSHVEPQGGVTSGAFIGYMWSHLAVP